MTAHTPSWPQIVEHSLYSKNETKSKIFKNTQFRHPYNQHRTKNNASFWSDSEMCLASLLQRYNENLSSRTHYASGTLFTIPSSGHLIWAGDRVGQFFLTTSSRSKCLLQLWYGLPDDNTQYITDKDVLDVSAQKIRVSSDNGACLQYRT